MGMRRVSLAIIAVLGCCAAQSAEAPVGVYDRDPEHLLNRLYRAVATRTAEGIEFGGDISEPYLDPFENVGRLDAVLDEFLASESGGLRGDNSQSNGATSTNGSSVSTANVNGGRTSTSTGGSSSAGPATRQLRQALLLNDVWAAFDLAAARGVDKRLQSKLARAVWRLRMPSAAIDALPDSYELAITQGGFARDYDPARPDRPFLPADLLDPNGSWVQIGNQGHGLIAPSHVAGLSGRSTFQVFIRCPGGRKATLDYLQTLNLYRTPWTADPAEIATRYPSMESVRTQSLRLNSQTPQFPAGTMVALLRRMVVIDEQLELVPTPITQALQLRVYRNVGDREHPYTAANFTTQQSVHDFVMRRRDLLEWRAGGLHAVTRDEREFRRATWPGVDALAKTRKQREGHVVLSTCARCHGSDGIFSVHSYTRMLSGPQRDPEPQLLPADDPDYQRAAAVEWKKQQFDWGLLRGLLAAQR
jgi:cytochrome c553